MNIVEAMKLLLEGKKIKGPDWSMTYIHLVGGKLVSNFGYEASLHQIPYELYEEPKKKVKLYKYIYLCVKSDRWVQTTEYFKDDFDFLKNFFVSKFLRLEHTLIEVEE